MNTTARLIIRVNRVRRTRYCDGCRIPRSGFRPSEFFVHQQQNESGGRKKKNIKRCRPPATRSVCTFFHRRQS